MNRVFIIAEAGVNHNGSLAIAKQLIVEAARSGADAVKFQTFKAENLASKKAEKADYQKVTTNKLESQFEMLKKLELDIETHKTLMAYAQEKGIKFLSTPFDLESADILNDLGLDIFKIPSGEITNLPLLEKIGSFRKKIILSTGMANLGEIEAALDILTKSGGEEIVLLHCNTEYPTPMKDVNLLAMNTIEKAFNVNVGYSDHTNGIEVPIAAVALGAKVIEKHFTLDKDLEGPDHRASLEPHELSNMVSCIRNIELALGERIKKTSESERRNLNIARKSIVASRKIEEGEVFTSSNITTKRPGGGMSPMNWYNVLGKRAKRQYDIDEMIEI